MFPAAPTYEGALGGLGQAMLENTLPFRGTHEPSTKPEKSGGPVGYYLVNVTNPNQGTAPYQAECGDIIEALGMDFNMGCEFKAIWRTAAAKTLKLFKEGGDEKYDAEKRVFYAQRSLSLLLGENVARKHKIEVTVKADEEIAQVINEAVGTVSEIAKGFDELEKSFDELEKKIHMRTSNIKTCIRSLGKSDALYNAVQAELEAIQNALNEFRTSKQAE